MTRHRFKTVIWVAMAIGLLVIGMAAAVGAARLLAYFQQGADPASALNIVPNKPLDWPVELAWLPDDENSGRELEPFTRAQIEAAYIRAWLQLTFSYQKGEPFGLGTYFTGAALGAVEAATESGLEMEQIATRHSLELHLYSADGSIVAFTDHAATVAQILPAGYSEEVGTYDVVMFLEEGQWKVRHWQRTALIEDAARQYPQPPLPPIRGINYYPQATPWDLFWTEYDPEIITQDIALMRELTFDTVRVFIPYQQFEDQPALLENVQDFMDQADAANLRVILTLFDFRADYQLLSWPDADRHAETVVTAFAEHPALFAWDIKNEPDLDYDSNGQVTVDAWLAHTIRLVRRFDPDGRVTIGWASAENAHTHADQLDFVSFHYYDYAEQFATTYAQLREQVSVPIVLTEFGLPTWNSPLFPNGHTEQEQAVYYAKILGALAETDSAGFMAWTLYDFTHVPSGVAGRWPWQKGPQRELGIVDRDGEMKVVVEVISAETTPTPIPTWARFLKPFWLTVMATSGAMFFYLYRKRRLRKI